jgi:hypothetical protein
MKDAKWRVELRSYLPVELAALRQPNVYQESHPILQHNQTFTADVNLTLPIPSNKTVIAYGNSNSAISDYAETNTWSRHRKTKTSHPTEIKETKE